MRPPVAASRSASHITQRLQRLPVWAALLLCALISATLTWALTRQVGTPQRLTQDDINAAVLHTLNTQELPSRAARAAQLIAPSVVRVQTQDEDKKNPKGEMQNTGVGSGVVIDRSRHAHQPGGHVQTALYALVLLDVYQQFTHLRLGRQGLQHHLDRAATRQAKAAHLFGGLAIGGGFGHAQRQLASGHAADRSASATTNKRVVAGTYWPPTSATASHKQPGRYPD